MKRIFYIRISLLTVILILSVSAVFIGSIILSIDKTEEATAGIICLAAGIPLIIFSIIKMVRLNKNFKTDLLAELKSAPEKILFQFSDTKSGKSVIIGKEVLFIDNLYLPYKDFYISLEDVRLEENELHFHFRKTITATRKNYSTDFTHIAHPPVELLPGLRKWISEK